MTTRLQELSVRDLDASPSVVDAAYRRVLWEEQSRAQHYPKGNVINKWDTLGQPASIWGLGHYLAENHPWNLKSLATAVQDIYELRDFSFENINNIITPDPRLASWWGQDLDREWLPEIIPHPSPPPPLCGQPGVVKRAARELGAFKWMFQGKDYGYAHMYALRVSGSFYYAILQELSKAVPLRNILRNLMGSCDLAEAWRRVGEEKRAAGRVQLRDFEA